MIPQATAEAFAKVHAQQRQWVLQGMSDAEFERRYDPAAYEHKQLIRTLEDIADAIRGLTDLPQRTEPRYTSRPTTPAKGPIEL